MCIYIYICLIVADLHCCVVKINATLKSNYPPVLKKSWAIYVQWNNIQA